MSNGTPRDIVASETQTSYVAYAINCNPNKDANWHNNSRLLVGGDDFAEVLPIKTSWLEDCDKFEMFNLRVTATTISDRFTHPIKTKKKNVKAKKVVQS